MEFEIIKKSKKSKARIGILKTTHGEIETPAFVPVATQAVVKTLTSEEAEAAKCRILIANTFHLHLKPGEKTVKAAGGIHKFMNWKRPLMTDSGGYQVFSLGFGRDYGVGKIIKSDKRPRIKTSFQRGTQAASGKILTGQQPKNIKITDDGVYFNSPVDGKKIFMGPKESMKIQADLDADMVFAFDECTSPMADYEYTKKSLIKTHNWAKICLKEFSGRRTKQALFGIVQGGKFKDLRIESAKFIGSLDFDGFGVGGEFGNSKKEMVKMINWVFDELPEEKPRHLLGIGHLEDIPEIIKSGVDLFDCVTPTHYARRGIAFTSEGKLDLSQSKYLKIGGIFGVGKTSKLDKKCDCFVCQNYSRQYITHLLKAKEITALKLLTFHNLYFFNSYIEKIRKKIKNNEL